ncbi:hypothetical protein HO133_003410 [Letharia lupina]|uniref:Uncharacterized protein n=1 Tax=Letharia lupina TaxID=560253 RepID=A0A8H6FA35_9LECA|nr:uncharacterized protein HO133_003410 [Letharia lupina]KAF6220278.1 hypothetical protein HO133_003410 [Letharia lupina]
MDPQAPSQPSIDTAYDNPDNPADQTASERKDATSTSASQQRSDPASERREPNDTVGDRGSASQNEAMPSSLGYGAQDSSGDADESMGGPVSNQEGEQMRAAGDGDIAAAQEGKHGFGEQTSLTSDLDRKKAEQAEIKDERDGGGGGGGVDVQGALGGGNKGFVGGGGETGQDSERGGGMQSGHTDV